MKYTEIDGVRYEVKDCGHCPFSDMSDAGWAEYCIHPQSGQDKRTPMDIDHDGFAKTCPLRDVQENPSLTQTWYRSNVKVVMDAEKGILHEVKPCPFCGSTNLKEVFFDDTGEILKEWMMENANRESESEGREGYRSWEEFLDANAYLYYIECGDCYGCITSRVSMEDAWRKWNRRE